MTGVYIVCVIGDALLDNFPFGRESVKYVGGEERGIKGRLDRTHRTRSSEFEDEDEYGIYVRRAHGRERDCELANHCSDFCTGVRSYKAEV